MTCFKLDNYYLSFCQVSEYICTSSITMVNLLQYNSSSLILLLLSITLSLRSRSRPRQRQQQHSLIPHMHMPARPQTNVELHQKNYGRMSAKIDSENLMILQLLQVYIWLDMTLQCVNNQGCDLPFFSCFYNTNVFLHCLNYKKISPIQVIRSETPACQTYCRNIISCVHYAHMYIMAHSKIYGYHSHNRSMLQN